ncbi:MAG: Rieske 2Fe-2S domain-containing protein [Pseudomonadota bacterium]
MAHGYRAVTWTSFKVHFDRWMLAGIALYLIVFIAITSATQPPGESFTPLQLGMRATGTLSFLMLTFILMIGPLARMSKRFKPFLYNRRHLGVATFTIALLHAAMVLLWYHGFSELNVFVSLFASNPRYTSIAGFPFESLGVAAFIILAVMATTSHDFWNANLGPAVWKTLHMGVYLAYGLLVAHVALGALQSERSPIYLPVLSVAAGTVVTLHLLSGFLASGAKRARLDADDWLDAGTVGDIPENRARILSPKDGERIAVFKFDGKIAAVTNVCRHQGGPLGEGKVIDGCITCPWHGFQYRMEDGQSPAPFTEKIATYRTRILDGRVMVHRTPNPPGTPQAPSVIDDTLGTEVQDTYALTAEARALAPAGARR